MCEVHLFNFELLDKVFFDFLETNRFGGQHHDIKKIIAKIELPHPDMALSDKLFNMESNSVLYVATVMYRENIHGQRTVHLVMINDDFVHSPPIHREESSAHRDTNHWKDCPTIMKWTKNMRELIGQYYGRVTCWYNCDLQVVDFIFRQPLKNTFYAEFIVRFEADGGHSERNYSLESLSVLLQC